MGGGFIDSQVRRSKKDKFDFFFRDSTSHSPSHPDSPIIRVGEKTNEQALAPEKKTRKEKKSEITDPQSDKREWRDFYFGASLTEMAASSFMAAIMVITVGEMIKFCNWNSIQKRN